MGIGHLTVLFPTEVSSFDFQDTDRTVQYKLNAQSLRLFGLHRDVNDAHRASANRLQNKQTLFLYLTLLAHPFRKPLLRGSFDDLGTSPARDPFHLDNLTPLRIFFSSFFHALNVHVFCDFFFSHFFRHFHFCHFHFFCVFYFGQFFMIFDEFNDHPQIP